MNKLSFHDCLHALTILDALNKRPEKFMNWKCITRTVPAPNSYKAHTVKNQMTSLINIQSGSLGGTEQKLQ